MGLVPVAQGPWVLLAPGELGLLQPRHPDHAAGEKAQRLKLQPFGVNRRDPASISEGAQSKSCPGLGLMVAISWWTVVAMPHC